MAGWKWMAWLLLFAVSIESAIASAQIEPVSWALQHSNGHNRRAEVAYEAQYSPGDRPPAAAGESLRVEFPVDYRERFVHYVTVNCSDSHIVRQMYANPAAAEALRTSDTVPSGTVLVMETYSARTSGNGNLEPTRLNDIFIREKRNRWQASQAGENSGAWRSAWYSPEGALVSSNQGSCIGCHAMVRDRDYLFTLPALVAAAATGQTQYQETEFGTSVCR